MLEKTKLCPWFYPNRSAVHLYFARGRIFPCTTIIYTFKPSYSTSNHFRQGINPKNGRCDLTNYYKKRLISYFGPFLYLSAWRPGTGNKPYKHFSIFYLRPEKELLKKRPFNIPKKLIFKAEVQIGDGEKREKRRRPKTMSYRAF